LFGCLKGAGALGVQFLPERGTPLNQWIVNVLDAVWMRSPHGEFAF